MLDFHYSDFWADPAKQIKPKEWEGFEEEELEKAVYEYTKDTLEKLKRNGNLPAYVQVEMRLQMVFCGRKAEQKIQRLW